jgi:hypothetical protein
LLLVEALSSYELRSADYPVHRWVDEPNSGSLFPVVIVHPKSPDFPLTPELALARSHGEDGTQVQGLVENNADPVLADIVGNRLFAEREVGLARAFNTDRNRQKDSSFFASCFPDIQHGLIIAPGSSMLLSVS